MKILLSLAALVLLAGCTTGNNPAGAPVPQLTFENAQGVPIRVAMLEMLDRSAAKRADDDRSDDFITQPVTALERYFRQRYRPSGYDGALRVIVEQAGTLVSEAPKPQGWAEGLIANITDWNKQDIYTLSMHVVLEASNGAATELKLHRQEMMPANPSLAQREKFLQSLIEGVIADLDAAAIPAMDRTLGILAVPSQTVRPIAVDQNPVMIGETQANDNYNMNQPSALGTPAPDYTQQQPIMDDPYTDQNAPVVPPLSTPEGWGQQYQ